MHTTKKQAIAAGALVYNTGKQCINGHLSDRRASDAHCMECQRTREGRAIACGFVTKTEQRRMERLFKHRRTKRTYARKRLLPEPTRPQPTDNACEICGFVNLERQVALDHCQDSNTFRGWLCTRCNLGLGYFAHDPVVLQTATDYVAVHRMKLVSL